MDKDTLKALQLILQNQTKSYDLVRGQDNGEPIPANSEKEAIVLKYELGKPARILGLQLRFRSGLEDCLISIKNNSTNSEIVSGEVQLSQIGNTINASIQRDELPVNFKIESGTNISVRIKSKGTAISEGDINLTMFGRFIGDSK